MGSQWQVLIDMRKQKRDSAQRVYLHAQQQLAIVSDSLEQFEAYRRQYKKELIEAEQRGGCIMTLLRYRDFIAQLGRLADEQSVRIEQLGRQREQALQQYRHSQLELRGVEKLKARKDHDRRRQEQRAELRQGEEVARHIYLQGQS